MFRLDRVVAIEVLAEAAAPPAGAVRLDLSESSASALRTDPADPLAILELAADSRWVPEYYPCEQVEELPGGGIRVGLRVADPDRIRRLILRLGGSVRVLGPAEFAATVRQTARAALANYGEQV
jgi:proteasome accessory factor C